MKDTWDGVCVDTAEEGALGCDGDRIPAGVVRFHCVCVCLLSNATRYVSPGSRGSLTCN